MQATIENLDELTQQVLRDLAEGGVEDLLQDMCESPYPYTITQLSKVLSELGYSAEQLLEWSREYLPQIIAPGSKEWYEQVNEQYSPENRVRVLYQVIKFGNNLWGHPG